MSDVPVRASSAPTPCAAAPPSAIISVRSLWIIRHSRTCLAGLRITCASAVGDNNPSTFPEHLRKKNVGLAIISLEGNQPPGVQDDAFQAASRGFAERPRRLRGAIAFRAHARSLGVTGPPVSIRTWSTITRNAASASNDFCTAFWTNSETLSDCFAATRVRISST